MNWSRSIGLFSLAVTAGVCLAVTGAHSQRENNADLVVNGKVVGKITEQRGGEICVVCNTPIGKDDTVLLIRGRRVAVHAPGSACNTALRKDPQRYLASLDPRGALISGEPGQSGISQGWLIFGGYVLAGLIFAALCAQRALHRGYGELVWFVAGLFFNVAAYAVLSARPKRPVNAPAGIPRGLGKISATYAPVVCACGARNHPSAKRCSTCGAALTPTAGSEVQKAGLSN